MKKLVLVLSLVCAAAALWPAASLAAGSAQRQLQPLSARPAAAANGVHFSLPLELRDAVHPRGVRSPAQGCVFGARVAAGPCTVTGQVLDFAGAPVSGAEVDLWCADGDGYYDWVIVDSSGSFTFTGVPATSGGELYVYLEGGDGYQSWNNTFTAEGPSHYVLRPGRTGAEVWRTSDPSWDWWQWLRVETWGSRGGGTTWIEGDAGDAFAMAPDCGYAVAYPYDNQGIEWSSSPMGMTAGANNGETMTFDQDEGRGAWLRSPFWGSGKPGTRTTLVLENWPAGYQMSFYGYSQAPSGSLKDWPYYVESDGAQYGAMKLTIPSSAPPGYDYEVHVKRYDDEASGLDLTVYFQVASLKASRSSIRRGGSMRFSGVVPTQGHMGSDPGKPKYVTLYRRSKAAGQPTTWDATRKGWVRVATIRANGYGKYASRLLHPRRTSWYTVRYPGDNWYWRAYTSVVKVRVR